MREQILAFITALGAASTELQMHRRVPKREEVRLEAFGDLESTFVTGEVPAVRPVP